MNARFLALLAAASAVALTAPTIAQDAPKSEGSAKPAAAPEAQVRTRDLAGTFGGQRIAYRATIADTILSDEAGKPEAVIVTTSYIKTPADPTRPVFFIYNGGPGSGSVWLQMGAFGPKRVAIPSDAKDDGAPPYPLLDNPESLLDVADLVFIDPPYDISNDEVATNLKALMPRLAKDAIVMLERSSRSGAVELPEGLELDEEKNFGDTTVYWLNKI